MSFLNIENLYASYGNIQALKGISLTVNQGEIVAIVGANGAGKTTLLTCISGLLPHKRERLPLTDRSWAGKIRPIKS